MTRATTGTSTAERILAAALDAFGGRGYEATSLDALAAELGVTKQTVLYWFPSKEALLDAVVQRGAAELAASLDGALAGSGHGLARVDAVMRAVFRFVVRRPAVLGLVREVNRLGPGVAGDLAAHLQPLVDRAVAFAEREMTAGTIRRCDPRLLVLFIYATVMGVATDAEAQRAVGVAPSLASLAVLRRELFAFVRAATISS